MAVLITGANRGIGRGLFDHYDQAGRTVFGTSRSGDAPFLGLDVTDPAAFGQFSKALNGAPVDLLICNAGVYLDKGQNLETGYGADLWAKTFATNVTGVFQTIQTLLPNLRAARAAKIAIISSKMASQARAPGGSYIYRASKAAVLNLGRNLAVDLTPDGIAVGLYHPGWVRTEMGGTSADISLEQSTGGLAECFDALSMDSTGCFSDWKGDSLPF
jgi:NAD(P)-dependent dehydrogenase (short-subunit alcohol dehydrogenase family)